MSNKTMTDLFAVRVFTGCCQPKTSEASLQIHLPILVSVIFYTELRPSSTSFFIYALLLLTITQIDTVLTVLPSVIELKGVLTALLSPGNIFY